MHHHQFYLLLMCMMSCRFYHGSLSLPLSLSLSPPHTILSVPPMPEGISFYQKKLTFKAKPLLNANSTIRNCGIKTGDSLGSLDSFLGGGGGMKFADVSNATNADYLVTIQWGEAPKWREASPGLCVEGICNNISCAAYEKMVIHNVGMKSFDLLLDCDSCKCPMCKNR